MLLNNFACNIDKGSKLAGYGKISVASVTRQKAADLLETILVLLLGGTYRNIKEKGCRSRNNFDYYN